MDTIKRREFVLLIICFDKYELMGRLDTLVLSYITMNKQNAKNDLNFRDALEIDLMTDLHHPINQEIYRIVNLLLTTLALCAKKSCS